MTTHIIPKVVAAIVILVGIMVIAGWFFDVERLVSIRPDYWPAMKFISAICFILSGMIVLFIYRNIHLNDEFSPYVASLASLVITLFVSTLLAARIFEISVGIENFFIVEKYGSPKSVIPGYPSILSMVNFMLIAIGGFVLLTRPKKCSQIFSVLGGVVGLSGVVALAGYMFNLPYLYSYFPGISSGVSFLSAVLFVLIGISLVLAGIRHKYNIDIE